ncbi:phage tail fiber protein [Citrobacter sp.]|uniref:phage tail fiber protein n=1 Tax=Citrobacter sp. TaxID=1896336 RepID=UPI002FC63A2C
MIDVSGFGLKATIVALQSFPMGFTVQQFADDVDPLEVQDDVPGAYEMMYDGSLFAYTQANPILVKISVLPGSEDDVNLKILLASRRMANKLLPISDVTSMVISYPDGGKSIFSNGSIISGPPADSIKQEGRKKGNSYLFAFGNSTGAQNTKQIASEVIQGIAGLF